VASVNIDHAAVLIAVVEDMDTCNIYIITGQVVLHPHGRIPHGESAYKHPPAPGKSYKVGAVAVAVGLFLCADLEGSTLSVYGAFPAQGNIFLIIGEDKALPDPVISVKTIWGGFLGVIFDPGTSQQHGTRLQVQFHMALQDQGSGKITARINYHTPASRQGTGINGILNGTGIQSDPVTHRPEGANRIIACPKGLKQGQHHYHMDAQSFHDLFSNQFSVSHFAALR
jgi:hypothetical protein